MTIYSSNANVRHFEKIAEEILKHQRYLTTQMEKIEKQLKSFQEVKLTDLDDRLFLDYNDWYCSKCQTNIVAQEDLWCIPCVAEYSKSSAASTFDMPEEVEKELDDKLLSDYKEETKDHVIQMDFGCDPKLCNCYEESEFRIPIIDNDTSTPVFAGL